MAKFLINPFSTRQNQVKDQMEAGETRGWGSNTQLAPIAFVPA